MKRSTILSLIVAASLMTLAVIVFIVGMTMAKFKFSAGLFTTSSYETVTHEITDELTDISINALTSDVEILPSEDGVARVVSLEHTKLKNTVEVIDGALTIKSEDTRRWIDHIDIVNTEYPKISIYLPSEHYGALSVDLSTGDIRVEDFSFASINIELTTGDVECLASSDAELNIHTTTGDIGISGASAASMSLKTTSGDVNIFEISCDGDIHMKSTTGSSVLTNVSCKNLSIEGGSGDTKMKSTVASESMIIDKTTGDVKLDACDAGALNIKLTTGDVEGTLLSDKIFVTHTTTGDIDVPSSTQGGTCEVSTTTGDIDIDVIG